MDVVGRNNTSKKKPMKIEDMTKEQIRHAIIKKKECNAKAQQIVESLLEKGITESYLLQCLPDINQAHFDDIIEERSIIHLCGYPVCEHTLSEKDIPKQKYRISLKTNKVYDITARKNFCSNRCYNAAMYVKKQMLTSPLWFREYETIPVFHLLPLQAPGSMGQEVDVSLVERVQIKSNINGFTSINDFAKASLNEIQNNVQTEDSNILDRQNKADDINPNNNLTEIKEKEMNQTDENKETLQSNDVRASTEKITDAVVNNSIVSDKSTNDIRQTASDLEKLSMKEQKKPVPNLINIVGDIVEKAEKKIDPILLDKVEDSTKDKKVKKISQKKQPMVTALTIEVEKCLAEWFTLDTMLFLFGDEKVREMVADKGECIKEYLNNYAKGIFYSANSYDQYQQLCRKLNMLELEERQHDAQVLQRQTRPLPDYSMLQEESKKMQLKVRAFLSGQTEFAEELEQRETSAPEDENVTQLPLVDKNAQNALRRRIVCQHLNKVLPDLLRSLGLLTLAVSSDMRSLVNTFKLRADNIMLKPIQWTLIALVFIKLLSIREKRLEFLLEQPTAFRHMQLLLLSYRQDGGYLDRLVCWLTDIDRLLDTNDIQLTIE